ncbi:MAG: molybdenum cofactor biosynthesis protein MoaE [Gammaproteobacteria bacterium]|jgi:molybdopterin synthase catalytic subunit
MQSNIYTGVSDKGLNILSAFQFVADDAHGGTAYFQGTVRKYNLGREVIGISYDIFEPLAIHGFNELCMQVQAQFNYPFKIYIEHAKGRLNVGDISVMIAVSSIHRDEAFKACRFLIEGIKHNSPIWKQEHYVDGNSEWAQGHALCAREQ